MDDKKYYIIAIFSSILFYIILVILLMLYISSKKVNSYDAMSKQTIIELDMITLPTDKISNKIVKKSIQKSSQNNAKKVVKRSISNSAKRMSTLKSLFAKTKVATIKETKKNVLNIKSSMINSRFKSKFEKEKKEDNIQKSTAFNKNKEISSKKIYLKSSKDNDEYYSKIYKILTTRWQQLPSHSLDELFIKCLIYINRDGIFEKYVLIRKSGNDNFDYISKNFLDKQVGTLFPVPNKAKSLEMTFVTKTKG
jgi:hypothetical protein